MRDIQVYIVDLIRTYRIFNKFKTKWISIKEDRGLKKVVRYLREEGLLTGAEKYLPVDIELDERIDDIDTKRRIKIDPPFKLPLILNGSGLFHHFTYVFCREIVDTFRVPYTVMHIDGHDDGVMNIHYKSLERIPDKMSCSLFYLFLMRDSPYTQAVLYIDGNGRVSSISNRGKLTTLDAYKETLSPIKTVDRSLEVIKTDEVYISIDLDVLSNISRDTVGGGSMDLNFLLEFLEGLKNRTRFIGADICGLRIDGKFGRSSLNSYAFVFSKLLRLLES